MKVINTDDDDDDGGGGGGRGDAHDYDDDDDDDDDPLQATQSRHNQYTTSMYSFHENSSGKESGCSVRTDRRTRHSQ